MKLQMSLLRTGLIFSVLLLTSCLSTGRLSSPLTFPENVAVPQKQLTIALLGATGMVGQHVLQEALAKGYSIRALARSPHKLEGLKNRISIVKGDARDLMAIDTLLEGSDLVISALGPVKADGDAAKSLNSIATAHILRLMPKHNLDRYILVSGAAVEIPGDDRNLTGWMLKKLVSLSLPDVLKDKQAEYRLLADSDVQWTLLRCPLIVPKPFEQSPRVSLKTPSAFRLRAGELAKFMIEQIDSREFVGKGPFIESR